MFPHTLSPSLGGMHGSQLLLISHITMTLIAVQVDTEGPLAKDHFLITYHGEPLNKGMRTLVMNMLQYYLSMQEVEKEESY